MTLSHAGSSQKKRRTRRRKVTGMPCQGRSAMVLVYRECVRAEPLPHRGQTEVASAEAALSVIRPALAERQMRSRFCESGRMVWFGIGDLGEWRNVGCPKQHARRFHRKPGRTYFTYMPYLPSISTQISEFPRRTLLGSSLNQPCCCVVLCRLLTAWYAKYYTGQS